MQFAVSYEASRLRSQDYANTHQDGARLAPLSTPIDAQVLIPSAYLLTLGPRMSATDNRPIPWVFAGAITAGAAIGATRGGGSEHWVTVYRR